MDLYFEEDCNLNHTSYSYNIGDVVCFLQNKEIYSGIIENISPCYHHNIKYIFYTVKETDNNTLILIEQDKIIENIYPEILLLEIEYNSDELIYTKSQFYEYQNFSFVIW